MAKKDVKQLNYTLDQINEAIDTALNVGLEYSEDNTSVQLVSGLENNKKILGSIHNPGAEIGGLTLKYIDDSKLRIYNTNGSTKEEDWTPVGDEILIISADPNAVSYRFDFTSVSATEPQVFIKESVDQDIFSEKWKIKYQIKQLDNKGNIIYDPITAKWTIKHGNNTRNFSENIQYGVETVDDIYSFNWIEKIYQDTNFYENGLYEISVTFLGAGGLELTRRWSYSLTSLTLKTSFDDSKTYKNESVKIEFSVKGDMAKTVFGSIEKVGASEDELPITFTPVKFEKDTEEQYGEFIVDKLQHGVYKLKLECSGVSGAVIINTPVIYKEFIYVEEGNLTPLIRWSYFEDQPLTQYTRTSFRYGVYNPSNPLDSVVVTLYNENTDSTQTRTVTADNTTEIWYCYPTSHSEEKQDFSISIEEKNLTYLKKIAVNKLSNAENIKVVAGESFDFNPLGRTNYDLQRNEYIYKGKNYLSVSDNFDWANGGWVQENIGTNTNPQIVDAFLIKAGSSMTLDYHLFAKDIRNSGKNMKFIFKTKNCQKMDALVMSCKGDNNTGLIINSQNSKIFNRTNAINPAIDLPYVEEEIIELEYNIEAENIQVVDQFNNITYVSIGRQPLLVTYLSSDPSQVVTCERSTDEGKNPWTQDENNLQGMTFGSNDCDIYLYRVKVYEKELSDREIMQNYYADAFEGPIAVKRYSDNNIIYSSGEINIEELKRKYPELRILMIDCEKVWSEGKKDYIQAYVQHHYPNGRLKDNWQANVGIAIQGTSSVEYLTSAGNFDMDISFKTMGDPDKKGTITNPREIGMKYKYGDDYFSKEELSTKPGISASELNELLETSYSMTDDSIPIDYINVKVNVASSENANNARLAEWFNEYNAYKRKARQFNDKIRDTMEFHPCVVFIRENGGLDNREFNNDGNYHFYACGDMGNSKKNNNVFGMGEEAQYIVDELINDPNSELTELDREVAIKEYQERECIVEVSNNIHDICRFKSAIFENYHSHWDGKSEKVVVTDVWDGDAVEFRYKNNKDKAKAETLRLWRWLFSTDATRPGYNEFYTSDVSCEKNENYAIYSFDTNIPFNNDEFTIKSIAPNFLLSTTENDVDQTFSKYDLIRFITEELKDDNISNYIIDSINGDGNHRFTITIPLTNLKYIDLVEEEDKIDPAFFVGFESKHVLNWNYDENSFIITDIDDTVKYRNNKFKAEYKDYFVEDSVLFHYLFTERFTMIDNRAKNTFIHTADGTHWDYCFNYDDDTALGCNNRGYLTMDYGVEDVDNTDGYPFAENGGTPAFNANDSVLWVNIRNNLYSELARVANKNSQAWSSTTMNADFEEYQGHKCNWLQMIDMRRKYLRPYTYGHGPDHKPKTLEVKYLPMLQGRKQLQRKRYQKYQEIYFESKYADRAMTDQFTFRAREKEVNFGIIPYIKCYPYILWDDKNSTPISSRVWPGQKYYPGKKKLQEDLNFSMYPAKYISAVEGLNNAGINSASMGRGLKLTSIDWSDNPNLPSGLNAVLELSENQTLLTSLNIRNTAATTVPNLSSLTNLRVLNTEDTNVTNITFANGGLIEEARLSSLTQELYCINNHNLTTLTIQETEDKQYNLMTVKVHSPSNNVNWVELLQWEKCSMLQEIELLNVDYNKNDCWYFENDEWISELYQLDKATLTGNIYIDQIREHDYNKYLDKWPGLELKYNTKTGFMPTYKISYYNDEYLTELLFEEIYDEDVAAKTPTIIPTKEPDKYYIYDFNRWSMNVDGIAWSSDQQVYAIYNQTDREYKISWWGSMSDAEPLATISCAYGETVEYPNELPTYTTTKIGFTTYYNLFSGWDKSTAGVAEDLDVVALWENGNYGNVVVSENDIYSFVDGFDTRELNASQIYSIIQNGLVVDLFGEFTDVDIVSNFDRVRIPLGNRFNYVNRAKTSLIPEGPMIFDGNQEEGYDTGIKLFEDDTKDWTLFLDIQYINAIKDAAMVSCYSGAVGFEILNSNENSQYAYPYVTYCGNNSNITNTNTGSLREVFVLTHKGGYYKPNGEYVDPVFTVYQGSLNKLQPTKKVVNKGSEIDFKTSENTLVLGGRREEISANRFRWLRKASGIIHHCDMWNELLSESECMELAYWPREDAEFTAVSFGSYYDENGKKTNIDLMPAQAAPAKVPTFETYNDIPTNYSFNETYIRRWMHERYYNALPITWKALIKNTRVPSSEYTKSTSSISVVSKLNKLYSPSQMEMAFNVDSYPGLEKEGRINPLLGYEDEYGIATYDGIKYNRRFAPSMPTFDVAPSGLAGSAITPSWIYTEQPTEAVANGSIWESGNTLRIYHYGFWMTLGSEVAFRSFISTGSIKYMQSSGTSAGTYNNLTDALYTLPHFSI